MLPAVVALVFVADPDLQRVRALATRLEAEVDIDAESFTDPVVLRAAATRNSPDALLVSHGFGGADGLELVAELRATDRELAAVAIVPAGHREARTAAVAML